MHGHNKPAIMIASVVTGVCFGWLLLFVLLSNTPKGKDWYNSIGVALAGDKALVPVLTLALPVLVAGSVTSLFFIDREYLTKSKGDPNLDRTAFRWILVPLVWYILTGIYRHFTDDAITLDDRLMEGANVFAVAGLVAASIFLIPVAHHGPLLHLMGWGREQAVRLHIWSARLFVIGSTVHGLGHMLRWLLAGEGMLAMLVPPVGCWTFQETSFEPTCQNDDTDCSCYDHFRNLTGFLAVAFMIIIAVSSQNSVRRRSYDLFLRIHHVAGPLALFFAIIHWNKSILYMIGGLLYYAATSFPVFAENRRNRSSPIRITSVDRIVSDDEDAPCVAIMFRSSNLALSSFRDGQYVRLLVRKLSDKPHPFTVNPVPGSANEMRVIFRATGKFTKGLDNLLDLEPSPEIYLDGFHGSSSRLRKLLTHDHVALIAGGIGITPMLSLLCRMHGHLKSGYTSRLPTRIDLHWACRDEALIEYVREGYFQQMLQNMEDGLLCRLNIRIYYTGSSDTKGVITRSRKDDTSGSAFSPSYFSVSGRDTIAMNMTTFELFTAISIIGLIGTWAIYDNAVSKSSTLSRVYAPIFVTLLAWICSETFVRRILPLVSEGGIFAPTRWTPVEVSDDSIEMKQMASTSALGSYTEGESEGSAMEEIKGRPELFKIVSDLGASSSPAIFMCGPVELMQNVRQVVRSSCESNVAVYEESFHM